MIILNIKLKADINEINKLTERILKIHSPLSLIANSYLEVDKLKERLNFAIKTKLNKEKEK